MKKTLLSISLFAALGATAQVTVTFEDLTLSPGTYYDGSDLSGQFSSNGVIFPNVYDTAFGGYWASGWVYSNTTNVTTPGYVNQWSAYAGGGSGGSSNYAISYGGFLDFGVPKSVQSLDITNNTYAALSMLNGDNYGKQFGSSNNALGQPDGTNGEDFFRVLIIGSDGAGVAVDTVTHYLADYRFANSAQDYILNTWQTVNLSAMGPIRYLDFVMESSDTNSFGPLTPTYFAMDNLVFSTAGIKEHAVAAFTLYPNPATTNVLIKGQAGRLTIYNATGSEVYSEVTSGLDSISLENWNSGFYVVELTNATGVTRSTLLKN